MAIAESPPVGTSENIGGSCMLTAVQLDIIHAALRLGDNTTWGCEYNVSLRQYDLP